MSSALRFERLVVRRMPGIDSEFELNDLAAGVNVIHGPNASGKTTTARALEALLWPRDAAPARAWLRGALTLGDERWTIDLDAGRARWQRNGQDADAPAVIPPAVSRDCYRFPLHELIEGDNRRLAEEILRVSAGGYDLKSAGEKLRPRKAATRAPNEVKALNAARSRLELARAKQAELRADELRLTSLEHDAKKAADAGRRARLLERAVEHARAAAEAERTRAAFEVFPRAMAAVRGDEADRLAQLRLKLEEARTELEKASGRRLEAYSTIESSGLPEGGVASTVVPALRERYEQIREVERAIEAMSQELAGAERKRAEELRALGDAVDEERLRALDVHAAAGIEGLAQEAESLRAERQATLAQLQLLGDGVVPDDVDRVYRAAQLLRLWLRSPAASPHEQRMRALALLAAAALAGAGVLGGLTGSPVSWIAAIAGLLLLVLVVFSRGEADQRSVHRREFERLGLDSPSPWEPDSVERLLEQLTQRLEEARAAERRAERRAELAASLERLERAWAELEERRDEIVARLGVAPDVTATRLYWLWSRITRWQDADRQAAGLAAAIEGARAQHAHALGAAAARIAEFGHAGAITTSAELKAAIDDLDRRRARRESAVTALEEAERARATAERTIAELEKERTEIFERLGLTGDHEADRERSAVSLCAEHPAYVKARDRLLVAEEARARAAEQLTGTAGFSPNLLDRAEDELNDALATAQRQAGELEAISEEITKIRTRVSDAKRGHDVEEALAEFERCQDELRKIREADTLSAIAWTLVDYVQQTTRDAHRPQVFRRARELFTRITHGRYLLDFDDGDRPAFRAIDTRTDVGHALDELSSGTRVQLLMAVRIAFVEQQEAAGVRLPLVFDETLGNSDDVRAEAIMDAILTLAADGRQVFYFTAQPDEVGKWRTVLERRPEVSHRIIDLAHVRRLAAHEGFTPAVADAPRQEVPEPDGMTHEEYGLALLVPPLDPEGDIGGIHLWYLFDELEMLHRLLRLHVESWGALRTLVESGGAPFLGPDGSGYRRAEAMVHAIDRASSLVRIGRGMKVDRDVLSRSRAVSDRFIDRVAELCRDCAGDAKLLMKRIDTGAVPRFRSDARERLRDYLLENGYLDERNPLRPDELRLRTLAAVAHEIGEGLLTPADVDRLLAHLGVRVPVSVA